MDPLHFDMITVDQGDGPVAIKLEFFNLDLIGLKTINVNSVK